MKRYRTFFDDIPAKQRQSEMIAAVLRVLKAAAAMLRCAYTSPWASMTFATFWKPATFAPTTKSPGRPQSTEAL